MGRSQKAMEILQKGTVIPATPLALDENRKFDEAQQRILMRYYLDCGVGGIATAVHTTQFEIREPEVNLLEPVLKVVSEEIESYEMKTGKVIVKVSGVCGPKEQAVKEAKLAKAYGYDAVLLSPGGLNDLSEDELIERTEAVAKIMPVIGFYLQTAVGGRAFSYNYWERLAAINNVVAIKCASFNRYQTLDVVRAVAMSDRCDDITLYTGNDDNIVIDLLTKYKFDKNGKLVEKSFQGGLLGHYSVWTRKAVEIFERIQEAKKKDVIPEGFLTLAAEVTDANSAFFDTANGFAGCIAGLHHVLVGQGLMRNIYCLNPQETLSAGQQEEIARVYRMYSHLNDDDFVKENLKSWSE